MMLKIKRLMLFITACIMLTVMPVTLVSAVSVTQDELEISFETSKDQYDKNEDIMISLSVKNNNVANVQDVKVNKMEAKGYSVKSDSNLIISGLSSGETKKIEIVLVSDETKNVISTASSMKKENSAPKTEDESNAVPVIILCVSVIAVVITVVTKKKTKYLVAIVLCAGMTGSEMNINGVFNVSADVSLRSGYVELSETVSVDDKETEIKAVISYNVDNQNLNNEGYEEKEDSITIDRNEKMFECEVNDGFVVDEKLESLNGTFTVPANSIKEIYLSVDSENLSIPQNDVILENQGWKIEEPQFVIGNNKVKITAVCKDGIVIEASKNIWNTSYLNSNLLNLDINDADKDGLLNYQEEQYGTNPNCEDTDGDGFSDIDEIFVLKTNPLEFTEDGDSDNDGLSNLKELANNTCVDCADTDYDGLNDYEELIVYSTDPRNADTDKDGINDFLEVKYGMDPCKADLLNSDGTVNIIYTPDSSNEISASIDISMTPNQLKSFEMEEIPESNAVISNEIPGYIGEGSAFDFSLDGTFKKAELTFEIPDYLLNSQDFDPGIYYYNEETQNLEELENTICEGNRVSVELEHFSKYILLNKRIYENVWNYDLRYDETGISSTSLDIVFVIDSSGSMSLNDSTGIRKTVTKNFIDKLTDNDKAAVIDFDSNAKIYSVFTNDKTALYNAVNKIDSSGDTNLGSGIITALDLFDSSEYDGTNKQKCIIMLTDGQGKYNTSYTTKAHDMDVTIYTVGLGDSVSVDVLTDMAKGAYGTYYPAADAEKLYGIFDTILDNTDLIKDSDGDGLVDYYEKSMASGALRLGTGVSLAGVDYMNPDSDGDGISDGDEITVTRSGNKIYVKMYSNPAKKDTDGDGINDGIEWYEVKTNIGNHKLNPLSSDVDKDGISDGEELGNYIESLGYYRVKSNPWLNENYNLGNQNGVSYISSYLIYMPNLTKKYFSSGTLKSGNNYTIYTFVDTSAIPYSTRKLVEVNKNDATEYYLLYATAGNNIIGGKGDEIYRRAYYDSVNKQLNVNGSLLDILINALNSEERSCYVSTEMYSDSLFMYYDNEIGNFIDEDGWKAKNFEIRFELNCDYDKYLPVSSYEAEIMGFEKLSYDDSKYHMPDEIKNNKNLNKTQKELVKGASHKYIRKDGLEIVYRLCYDVDNLEAAKQDPNSTELLSLQKEPKIGPTYNYCPNDNNKVSDLSIGHYYFDMLPYYWWGATK